MSFVSAVETVGDVSAIAKGGAKREATEEELYRERPTLTVLELQLQEYLVGYPILHLVKMWV